MQPVHEQEAAALEHTRLLNAQEVLFRQGELGEAAYVIESGLVEIYSERGDEREVIARLGANEIFGEMALLGDRTRSASVRALETTRLLVVTPKHLGERLEGADPMTRHLLRIAVLRCRELLARVRSGQLRLGGLAPPLPLPKADPGDEGAEVRDRNLAFGRLRIEQELRLALERQEFQLHYQPIVHAANGHIAGFEALLRWFKPGVGRVPPDEFIPVAEASGLICSIGRWVIQAAVEDLLRLDDARRRAEPTAPPLFMTVNLSARQLEDPELLPALARHAERLRGQGCRLKLEVTESLMIGNVVLMQALIASVRQLGMHVVLDDFGTGYCSLSYLHLFEVHTMKLDRSFVRGMAVSEASQKVVGGIVGIAHALGMDVVVEGVETDEQAAQARALGVDYAQGYHFGRPVPLAESLPLLARGP